MQALHRKIKVDMRIQHSKVKYNSFFRVQEYIYIKSKYVEDIET